MKDKNQKKSGFQKTSLSYKYLITLFILLIFCILDGIFTLWLVERGAWEANPLMRHALSISYEFFFLLKYFLTAGGIVFLLHHGDRRIFGGIFTVEEIAGGIVLFYEGLIIYEVTLYVLLKK